MIQHAARERRYSGRPMHLRLDRWVPAAAVVAPIVAFAVGGTAVPIDETWEHVLQVAAWPVLAVAVASVVVNTRLARVVAGAAMVVWWGFVYLTIMAVNAPRTSLFGLLTVAAVPIVVAFTWGKPWTARDIEERSERTDSGGSGIEGRGRDS